MSRGPDAAVTTWRGSLDQNQKLAASIFVRYRAILQYSLLAKSLASSDISDRAVQKAEYANPLAMTTPDRRDAQVALNSLNVQQSL